MRPQSRSSRVPGAGRQQAAAFSGWLRSPAAAPGVSPPPCSSPWSRVLLAGTRSCAVWVQEVEGLLPAGRVALPHRPGWLRAGSGAAPSRVEFSGIFSESLFCFLNFNFLSGPLWRVTAVSPDGCVLLPASLSVFLPQRICSMRTACAAHSSCPRPLPAGFGSQPDPTINPRTLPAAFPSSCPSGLLRWLVPSCSSSDECEIRPRPLSAFGGLSRISQLPAELLAWCFYSRCVFSCCHRVHLPVNN